MRKRKEHPSRIESVARVGAAAQIGLNAESAIARRLGENDQASSTQERLSCYGGFRIHSPCFGIPLVTGLQLAPLSVETSYFSNVPGIVTRSPALLSVLLCSAKCTWKEPQPVLPVSPAFANFVPTATFWFKLTAAVPLT